MNKTQHSLLGSSLRQWYQAGQYYDYQGLNIYYQDSDNNEINHANGIVDTTSTRPALLLIHGFPTASWDWVKIWSQLTVHYRVVTLDMIGFGFSDKPVNFNYTIAEQANVFEALLRYLDIKDCHIVAHDYGDTVAQELLHRHARIDQPSSELEIKSVSLLNGGLFPESHRPKLIQSLLNSPLGGIVVKVISKRSVDKSMCSIFGQCSQPSEQELEEMWQLISFNNGKRIFHKLIGYMTERKRFRDKWLSSLTHAKCPIQLINGTADPISGEHMVKRFETLVSSENIHRLENIGHYPQMEAPTPVSGAIISFINKH